MNYTGHKKKKPFFQTELNMITYSGARLFPKHENTFRISLNQTGFQQIYFENSRTYILVIFGYTNFWCKT